MNMSEYSNQVALMTRDLGRLIERNADQSGTHGPMVSALTKSIKDLVKRFPVYIQENVAEQLAQSRELADFNRTLASACAQTT
ncbi:MAG: hypothetical protein OXU45_08955 [Candidatus Melainabacteria bacterium]|nr:hypothetical protein [Candidatus Melainabacteria bacterium]